jgi:hypothetical protein
MSNSTQILTDIENLPYPYILTIENKTDVIQDWFLFGSNLHCMADNFGNKPGIYVKSNTMMPYPAILLDFISNSINTNLIRFYSDNKQNLESNLIIRNIKFNRGIQRCETLKEHFDPNQLRDNVIDVKINIEINKNTHLSGKIQANSKIEVFIFPVSKNTNITKQISIIIKLKNFFKKWQRK